LLSGSGVVLEIASSERLLPLPSLAGQARRLPRRRAAHAPPIEIGELVMAYHGEEEALKAGRRSLAVWAITSVALLILGILFATGTISGSKAPARRETALRDFESQRELQSQQASEEPWIAEKVAVSARPACLSRPDGLRASEKANCSNLDGCPY